MKSTTAMQMTYLTRIISRENSGEAYPDLLQIVLRIDLINFEEKSQS